MDEAQRAVEQEVVEASRGLRSAVHALAAASMTRRNDPERIEAAAALVREATALLDGEPLGEWWEGPAVPAEDRGLQAFRRRSLFQGALHPFSSPVRWFDAEGPAGEDALGFEITLTRLHGGPPRAVHGGYVAGLFDELLGAVQGRAPGGGGFTGRLEVRYRSLTPLDAPLRFTGWIEAAKGRRITVVGRCEADGVLCADAKGLFVRPVRGIA